MALLLTSGTIWLSEKRFDTMVSTSVSSMLTHRPTRAGNQMRLLVTVVREAL